MNCCGALGRRRRGAAAWKIDNNMAMKVTKQERGKASETRTSPSPFCHVFGLCDLREGEVTALRSKGNDLQKGAIKIGNEFLTI
jgi:hypothetical protein